MLRELSRNEFRRLSGDIDVAAPPLFEEVAWFAGGADKLLAIVFHDGDDWHYAIYKRTPAACQRVAYGDCVGSGPDCQMRGRMQALLIADELATSGNKALPAATVV